MAEFAALHALSPSIAPGNHDASTTQEPRPRNRHYMKGRSNFRNERRVPYPLSSFHEEIDFAPWFIR